MLPWQNIVKDTSQVSYSAVLFYFYIAIFKVKVSLVF